MTRRRSSSNLEAIFLLARLIPWWLSVAVAVLTYFFFSQYANQPIAPVRGTGAELSASMTAMLSTAIWKPFAMVLQYVVPLIFGAGALLSVLSARPRAVLPAPADDHEEDWTPSVPACPVCASPMVSRIARHGVNAGNRFWGCSQYPHCRGTRD